MPHNITELSTYNNHIKKLNLQQQVEFLSYFPDNNPAPVFSMNKNKEVIYLNESARSLLSSWHQKYNQGFSNRFTDVVDCLLSNPDAQ